MRIIIFTQDEPFYLAENLNYLINRIPSPNKVVGCVVSNVSPFGRQGTMLKKAKLTYDTFGFSFFCRYAFNFLRNKLNPQKRVPNVMRKFGIPILNIYGSVNSANSLKLIERYNPDLLISVASNQIFKRSLIEIGTKGCLNLHTALLPKYRGLMPTFWAMKNNEKYSGVSVFFVDEGIDSGPILVQKKVEIGNRTLEELIRYTKKVGMDAIIEAIELIYEGSYELINNDASKKSYYTFPTRRDVKEFINSGKKFY